MRILHLCGVGLSVCIVAHSARAGDSTPFYRAPLAIGTYGWAGCYVGAEGGGNWGMSRHDAIGGPAITDNFGMSGSLVGGTLGCNYQNGNLVLGVEDDMSWTNKSGSAYDVPPFDPNTLSQTNENWIDTLRVRVGLPWDRWLGYFTGGVAFAGTSVSVCNTLGCVTDSAARFGWTVGAGVEYALIGQWTLKVEYLYANFGTASYIGSGAMLPGGFTVVPRYVTLSDNIARFGINYKFLGP